MKEIIKIVVVSAIVYVALTAIVAVVNKKRIAAGKKPLLA